MMVPGMITRRRLTFEDYEALPDDQDYEIIDGVLYVLPRARARHQVVANRFAFILTGYTENRGQGALFPDTDLIVDDKNTYISPDLMYFAGDRLAGTGGDDWIRTIPDLVVEILSPSTEDYDRGVKRRTYAALGVPHYWIANATAHSVIECLIQPSGRYQERTHGPDGQFRSEFFPDLDIDLAWIFRPI